MILIGNGGGLYQHNPNITWDIIQNNPDKKWNWDFISRESKYNMGNYTK